jgi:plasmid stabilization system protein ParE
MRIRWTPAAAADLERINNYLRVRHPLYRQPTMRKLHEAIRSLKEQPHRGRLGREDGTRELLFPPLPCCGVTLEGAKHRSDSHLPWRPKPRVISSHERAGRPSHMRY